MKKLSKLGFYRIFFRSFFFQSTWNYERMLNLGYCFCMLPFIKEASQDKEVRKKMINRNMRFFNSNPYLSNYLVGLSINCEEKNLNSNKSFNFDTLERLKRRLSESLAVIGDQLIWARLRPIAAFIGFGISLFWGILGPIVFFLLFNVVQLYVRFKGLVVGYRDGERVVKSLNFKQYNKLAEYMFNFGAFLAGFVLVMIPISESFVNLAEIAIFLASLTLMFFLLRIKVTVPISLILLIFAGIFTGAIIY